MSEHQELINIRVELVQIRKLLEGLVFAAHVAYCERCKMWWGPGSHICVDKKENV